jgi:glycosyltransferase involved in cell wall biosynthesis
LRILMLTDLFLPVLGGLEQVVDYLSTGLAQRGHQVAIATLWQKGLSEFEARGCVRIYRLRASTSRIGALFRDPRRPYAPPCPDPEVMSGLRAVITQERPEIVHAHNWMVHSFLPLKAWSGAKLVVTLHDYGLICPKRTLFREGSVCGGPSALKCMQCCADHYGAGKGSLTLAAASLTRGIERRMVDKFTAVSRAVAESCLLTQIPDRYAIVPAFVPDDVAEPAVNGETLPEPLPEEPFILFVGALGLHKGVGVLLDAYAELDQAPPLVLIGMPWSDTPRVLPSNVRVLASWPHDAVMEAWRRCLFGVIPSVWADPCPTVTMEAMAAGRAVIASDVGGLSDEVVDEETGLLVGPGDPRALRHAMQRLLDDPCLRLRMEAASGRRAFRFMSSAVIPQYERVYEEVSSSC